MLAELATFALCLAFILSILQASSLSLRYTRALLAPAAACTALLIFLAFVALILLRIDSDFSVLNVAEHSNRAMPLLYKIAGSWGNHEGSMLLFVLVLALVGAALIPHAHACAIQGLLTSGILAFILATSNPFTRLFPPAMDGKMLNPLLQDMALAFHPPMLYLGYIGFSAVFSLAVAALWRGTIDQRWAEIAHPWVLSAWSTLTCGIALGSWWAYRELGWGGYWFWDPVENASLMPWLAGTALLHSNLLLKKRGQLAGWVCLLSILTFGLSLIGTFLVRSGAITSVHSFASDPQRGLAILAYIALTIGGALWLYGKNPPRGSEGTLSPLSREGMMIVQNLLLVTACATVLLGTLYPMLLELLYGEQITVGAPYFNHVVLPLLAFSLFLAALAAFCRWQQGGLLRLLKKARHAFAASIITAIIAASLIAQTALISALCLGLASFLIISSTQWLGTGKWRNPRHWPVFLGHIGAAILLIGVTGTALWSEQSEGLLQKGESLAIAGYHVALSDVQHIKTPNYDANMVTLSVQKQGALRATLHPEYRRYPMRNATTSEAAIYSNAAYDLMAVAGEHQPDGRTAIRLYFKPAISFLWLGALLMAAGGMLAATLQLRRKSA